MMLLAKSTTGTKVLGTRPKMQSETGFFTRRGHLKPYFAIRQQHPIMYWPVNQGGNEGAEQRFASLAGVVDELEEALAERRGVTGSADHGDRAAADHRGAHEDGVERLPGPCAGVVGASTRFSAG